MNSKLQVKQKLQQALSTLPEDDASEALREILRERTSEYQVTLKEQNEVIKGIQLENLSLKGSLRESDRLLQQCVGLLQDKAIKVPLEIATHLGIVPHPHIQARGSKCS
jgi:hypothetical protein